MSTSKPRAWKGVFTIVRGAAFTAVEVAAALALSGWLSIALWVMAAWNAFSLIMILAGLSTLAARQAVQEQAGAGS